MSHEQVITATPPEIRISQPELRILEFSRKEGISPNEETVDASLEFSLGLNRPSRESVGVQLSVEVDNVPGVQMKVAYRIVATLQVPDDGPADLDQFLKLAAVHVAPTILYPFLREAVASIAMRSGISGLVLPVVNFRQVFKPEEFTLPPISAETSEALSTG